MSEQVTLFFVFNETTRKSGQPTDLSNLCHIIVIGDFWKVGKLNVASLGCRVQTEFGLYEMTEIFLQITETFRMTEITETFQITVITETFRVHLIEMFDHHNNRMDLNRVLT